MKTPRTAPLFLTASLLVGLAACGGNEQVRDDPQPTSPPPEAAPVEPEPAPVEAAPEASFDINLFEGQARVTGAKNAAGETALKVSSVKDGSGWASCGIQSGDVLISVGGAAVDAKSLDALYEACAKGGKDIMVERGGNAQKVGPLKSE
ncbi:MAG: hypothetical protein GY822_01860 [Deltaproteobacteria bacterium]|nr:hypothetical protein [Deltaproteobacteria bacterium]